VLGPDEQRRLLRVARSAIEARLRGQPRPDEPADGILAEPRGAFVTLRRRADRELRGCVGYVEPRYSLLETVARAAAAAATSDDRFAPIALDEVAALTLDVSVLGPLLPISPDAVRIGTHGLVVRWRGRSGLLLPQVAVEHGWDAEAFLDRTCHKAGLPADTWRLPGVELLGFSADVCGEDEP
jgi:AmmeMemoRadiSam system protein A